MWAHKLPANSSNNYMFSSQISFAGKEGMCDMTLSRMIRTGTAEFDPEV
jgi:hypothetical protein